MARQPRFIDDDAPRRTGNHAARYERGPSRFAPDVSDAPKTELHDELSERIKAAEREPAQAEHFSDDSTKVFAIEKGGRFDDEPPKKGGGKKLALMILAIVLVFAIIGAGVYALVHFVLTPDQNTRDQTTVTEIPAIPEEPSLTPDPTKEPTEPPTEAPTEKKDYAAMADEYMKKMSDREKICQLFIVTPEVLTAGLDDSDSISVVTQAGEMTKSSLEEYPVGGVIYFAGNLESQDQTTEMISNSQKYSATPLFIAVDEEGGDVARVASKLGTQQFKPMFEYKDKGESTAHDNAEIIASNLRALGFNMDNAPVADVLSNPDNTVIGHRAYSDDFTQAAALVSSAVKGFNDGGVINVLKHFPGHGDTDEDSHEGFAYVKKTADELKKNELLPFKSGIEAGADMVMVGHLVVEDLDPDNPATLSSKVVPELLRKELKYDGIVITDSMSMGAITENYGDYETIVKGLFAADIDIILQPDDLDGYISAIESLLDSGDITQEQIDAKVKKILTLKYSEGIMKASDTAQSATEAASAAAQDTTDAPESAAESPDPVTTALPEEEPSVAA